MKERFGLPQSLAIGLVALALAVSVRPAFDVEERQLPAAPSAYAAPPLGLSVRTSAEFLRALRERTPSTIVLENGEYENDSAFMNDAGHRIYARSLGGAVLRAGLVLQAHDGARAPLVQGLRFDVRDRGRTIENSALYVWGTGRGATILDSTFEGNRVIGHAIVARQPDGLVIRRIHVRNFASNGITVDANDQERVLRTPVLLEDLDVAHVSRPTPRSSNGTSEACVWLGNTGAVRRAVLRDCAWMGLWTGTANKGSTVEHVDIDETPTGMYLEHFTTSGSFRAFRIGPSVEYGVKCEWADPDWGGRPGCVDNVIEHGVIASARVGVYLDEGTTRVTVRRVSFVGQNAAAIVDYKGIENSYADNDYGGIASGAVDVSRQPPRDDDDR